MGPKTGRERIPNVFLNITNVASMGSLAAAFFKQTAFPMHALGTEMHHTEVGVLCLFWAYFLWAFVLVNSTRRTIMA